jgi:hypothetical protein
MRQTGSEGSLEIVAAVARQKIVREYEQMAESLGARATVILSSSLATLPILEGHGSTLLVRMSARALTTVIVRDSSLCVYRSTDMPSEASLLDPQAMLDEIFPAIAYFQDTWGGSLDRVRLSGLGTREEVFRRSLSEELKVPVAPLADAEDALLLGAGTRDLMQHDMDALVGWMMNGGS